MKIPMDYIDDDRQPTIDLPSKMGMDTFQRANEDRAHALHLAELSERGRDATASGDDLAAIDYALRHDYAEALQNAGRANDIAARDRFLEEANPQEGYDRQEQIDLAEGQRDALIQHLAELKEQHEAFRKEAAEKGRQFNDIEDRESETVETQDETPIDEPPTDDTEARQRPEGFGRRRGWDSDAQQARDQGEGAQQQGEPFAARLARMKAEREQQGETARDGQRDGHAERGATPTCDAQGEAYQPRPAGFDRRCDAVDRAAETQKEQAETTKQDERTKPPRVS